MNREKAIDLLDNLIGMVEDNQESDYDTALKMGKQALSQEPCRVKNELNVELNELKPCDDAVSREAVLNAIEHEDKWLLAAKGHNGLTEIAFSGLKARVDALPSVTQKSGKWINDKNDMPICSRCGYIPQYDRAIDDYEYSNYCPSCGAKMVEPQESEE